MIRSFELKEYSGNRKTESFVSKYSRSCKLSQRVTDKPLRRFIFVVTETFELKLDTLELAMYETSNNTVQRVWTCYFKHIKISCFVLKRIGLL